MIVPVFFVGSEPDRRLGQDLIRLEIEATLHGHPTMHAEFAAGNELEVGTTIQVSLGTVARQSTVFDGEIAAIDFVFEESAPPTVVVSASGSSLVHPEPSSTSLILARGNELVSAHVRVQKARAFVTVSGHTTGSPDIAVGSLLRLERIGASFSGAGYKVTRVRHTFDLEHGLTSTFEAQRAL
jgi:hypothetical protein